MVAHTGPQPVPGVSDEVQYTFVVRTNATTAWVDEDGNFDSVSPNIMAAHHVIDYPEETDQGNAIHLSFPDEDRDWVGGNALSKDDGNELIETLSDDNTVVGAVFGYTWRKAIGLVPFLGDAFLLYHLVSDLASVNEDQTEHETDFQFGDENQSGIDVYRKFTVTMDKTDTAEIEFRHQLDYARTDYDDNDAVHTVTLDPANFIADIGGHPFEQAIRALVDEGAISGYGDGTFRPERSLTRAEFVSMIDEALAPSPTRYDDSFTDIDGHWAETKIMRVAGAGYISGFPDGTFRPDENIRKVSVIAALDAGEGYSGGDTGNLAAAYDDAAEIPDWGRQAVADAHAAWGGIDNYPDDGVLEPKRDATRAEAAKYVYDASR
jgi:hypothetical protein